MSICFNFVLLLLQRDEVEMNEQYFYLNFSEQSTATTITRTMPDRTAYWVLLADRERMHYPLEVEQLLPRSLKRNTISLVNVCSTIKARCLDRRR